MDHEIGKDRDGDRQCWQQDVGKPIESFDGSKRDGIHRNQEGLTGDIPSHATQQQGVFVLDFAANISEKLPSRFGVRLFVVEISQAFGDGVALRVASRTLVGNHGC